MSNILPAGAGSKRPPINLASSIELRLRALVPRIYALGEGPLYHLLSEVVGGADPLQTAENYASLPADFIKVYAGDKLPPALTVVRSS
jgi:hypothetical protein